MTKYLLVVHNSEFSNCLNAFMQTKILIRIPMVSDNETLFDKNFLELDETGIFSIIHFVFVRDVFKTLSNICDRAFCANKLFSQIVLQIFDRVQTKPFFMPLKEPFSILLAHFFLVDRCSENTVLKLIRSMFLQV